MCVMPKASLVSYLQGAAVWGKTRQSRSTGRILRGKDRSVGRLAFIWRQICNTYRRMIQRLVATAVCHTWSSWIISVELPA